MKLALVSVVILKGHCHENFAKMCQNYKQMFDKAALLKHEIVLSTQILFYLAYL